MTSKKRKSNKKPKLIKFIYKYWFVILAVVIVLEAAAVMRATDPGLPPNTYQQYQADAGDNIKVENLGLSLKIDDQLKKQGLIAVPSNDDGHRGQSTVPGASLTFTTEQLAKKYSSCDGINGGIGSLTRYQGPSSAMSEHHHLSTVFDYTGFHVVYQAVETSCVASSPSYSAKDLGQETAAARQLWEAIKTARVL